MSEINVQLGGRSAQASSGATVADAIKQLDRDAAKQALAAKVNGREFDLSAKLEDVARRAATENGDASEIGAQLAIEPVLPNTLDGLDVIRHSTAHLLAAATSWAEVIGASRIYIGAVAEDSSGYPDCRPEFYEAFQRVISVGTRPTTRIEIRTPVIHMTKAEIVRRGLELEAPLRLTWSCYQSEEKACGRCDSCALRLRAFREAGVEDPIPYA